MRMNARTYHLKPLSKGRPKGSKTFDVEASQALGQAIRIIRLEKGISQEALANGANLDRSHLSRIERGINAPVITVIFRVADFLGVKSADIITLAEKILKGEVKVLESR